MITIPLLGICLLSPSVFAQFGMDSVHPDVTFGDGNDRFDLSSMIKATNKRYHQNQMEDEDGDAEDGRRNLNSDEEDLEMHILDDLKEVKPSDTGVIAKRRSDDSFAYHDAMDSSEGRGTRKDFEDNLKHFMKRDHFKKRHHRRMGEFMDYLHGNEAASRRSGSPDHEQEVLMHYAMPIVMTIDGFMKVPLH